MRQLKFRAWDGKQMQTDFNLFSEGGAFSIDGNEEVFRHENWIVMQFTGLHDKNGVEMYEGDLIEYRNIKTISKRPKVEAGDVWTGEIVFDSQSACFAIKRVYEPFGETFQYIASYDEPEIDFLPYVSVFGNIYEHPHLIEKEAVK